MIKGLFFAVSIGSLVLLPGLKRNSTDILSMPRAALSNDVGKISSPADNFKVILLGSGAGPRVDLKQYGPSILVEAGDMRMLFDCGRGSTFRMAQLGISHGSISR